MTFLNITHQGRSRLVRGFVIALLLFIIALWPLSMGPFDNLEGETEWGITFSVPYAKALQIDWQAAYIALLDDLKVRLLRIPVYWPDVEPTKDTMNFTEFDWMIDQAELRGARVLLVVGRRAPRWPECHVPEWAVNFTEEQQQEEIIEMISVVVEHYKDRAVIAQWQVGNEPYVEFFGTCPKPDPEFIDRAVKTVRDLDPSREIVITDSGELGSFWRAARHGDILGSTMYKVVPRGKTSFGYTKWYLPSWFYRKKANLARRFAPNFNGFIIAELQAEPWAGEKFIRDLTPEEQDKSIDIEQFRKNIEFARKAKVEQVYLWGAEWWYWTWIEQGRPEFWEATRSLW